MAQKTPFIDLCNVLECISNTSSRLEIQSILSCFLKRLIAEDKDSIVPTMFLCTATFHPQYHNIELGIGDHVILTVVSEATGLSIKTVKQKYVKSGDLGAIAMENRVRQLLISKRQLTIIEVFDQIRSISRQTGKNSTNSKKNVMLSLINASSPLETKYLIRLFEARLKIGLAMQTVLVSLAISFNDTKSKKCDIEKDEESDVDENHDIGVISNEKIIQMVKDAYNKQPDFEHLVGLILQHGIENLPETCKITPTIPLKPMLAQPSNNLTKAFSRVENVEFVSEYKYDGERVQIHHKDGKTEIFSRNSENLSQKYPDLVSLNLHDKSFIIDGEVVAYEDGRILPFQVLSTRKRKNIDKIEVQVCVFAFDILYFDSEELLNQKLRDRRQLLFSNFNEVDDKFKFVNSLECKSVEDIDGHFKQAIQNNCEGVMIKSLESVYRPSLRTNSWVKIKNDYLESCGDSMDLIVMGAFYGKGKRTGTYGGFLLGSYNDETELFEACCKIGTGFSDENLQAFYSELSDYITADLSQYVFKKNGVKPDVWFTPRAVWEVRAASLSLSPIYSAGKWDDKGISLRFPRFIRVREDKSAVDATTSNQILRMYNDSKNEESEDEFN